MKIETKTIYKFKQPLIKNKLFSWLKNLVPRKTQPITSDKPKPLSLRWRNFWQSKIRTRGSIKHESEYIFSAKKAKEIRPDLVEETNLKKIYYSEGELEKAILEMPDYDCWDQNNKVLIKEVE